MRKHDFKKYYCINCNKLVWNDNSRCKECYNKYRKENIKPKPKKLKLEKEKMAVECLWDCCFYCGQTNYVRIDRYKKLICAECNEDIYGGGKK